MGACVRVCVCACVREFLAVTDIRGKINFPI